MNFTWQELEDIFLDLCYPPLYYATWEECEQGKVLYVKEGKYTPDYIVFHPLDLDEIQKNVRLVPIKDYPRTVAEKERFRKQIEQDAWVTLGRKRG